MERYTTLQMDKLTNLEVRMLSCMFLDIFLSLHSLNSTDSELAETLRAHLRQGASRTIKPMICVD